MNPVRVNSRLNQTVLGSLAGVIGHDLFWADKSRIINVFSLVQNSSSRELAELSNKVILVGAIITLLGAAVKFSLESRLAGIITVKTTLLIGCIALTVKDYKDGKYYPIVGFIYLLGALAKVGYVFQIKSR